MTLPEVIKNNPAAFIDALRALAIALLTFLAAFGLAVSPEQQAAILQLGGAIFGISILFTVANVKATVPKTITDAAPVAAMQKVEPAPYEPPSEPTPPPSYSG